MTVAVLRRLDLVTLAVALPIFAIADLPLPGYAVAGAAWLVQRAIQVYLQRRAAAADDVRATVGLLAGSMIGRGWFVALSIFAVGLTDSHAGLAAAVLCILLFTIYFTVGIIMGSQQPKARESRGPQSPLPDGSPR